MSALTTSEGVRLAGHRLSRVSGVRPRQAGGRTDLELAPAALNGALYFYETDAGSWKLSNKNRQIE